MNNIRILIKFSHGKNQEFAQINLAMEKIRDLMLPIHTENMYWWNFDRANWNIRILHLHLHLHLHLSEMSLLGSASFRLSNPFFIFFSSSSTPIRRGKQVLSFFTPSAMARSSITTELSPYVEHVKLCNRGTVSASLSLSLSPAFIHSMFVSCNWFKWKLQNYPRKFLFFYPNTPKFLLFPLI